MPSEEKSNKDWELEIGSHARRDLKDFNKAIKTEIVNKLKEICKTPYDGDSKGGDLKHIWTWPVNHKGKKYRIAYRINVEKHSVTIFLIGPRGEFYEKLKQYING